MRAEEKEGEVLGAGLGWVGGAEKRERGRGANHFFSSSNYKKASLSRAPSSSRTASPALDDILVPEPGLCWPVLDDV